MTAEEFATKFLFQFSITGDTSKIVRLAILEAWDAAIKEIQLREEEEDAIDNQLIDEALKRRGFVLCLMITIGVPLCIWLESRDFFAP